MHYIVFDLEFNQDFSSLNNTYEKLPRNFLEIIQIGAVKLDPNLNILSTFNRYIRPVIYMKVSPFVTELTSISTEQLLQEEAFPAVYKDYMDFVEGSDSVFCTWGISDVKELFKNADFFKLNQELIPKKYINLQPVVSKRLNLPPKKLLQLQNAVESLHIPKVYEFHNALYDAYYTAEIFQKVNQPSIEALLYDPSFKVTKPRQKKREVDYVSLLKQFEKMYSRALSKEEEKMVKLAYRMGRTNQFIKEAE